MSLKSNMKPEDKDYLVNWTAYTGVSRSRIHLDEYRDWMVQGRNCTINTDGKWWYMVYLNSTPRKWTSVKKKLSFMEVSQDGDDEGILKLDRMLTEEEAKIVRKIGGFRISGKF